MGCRLGIDVGGTFTDLLLFDEQAGDVRLLKTPSTPDDQSVGILRGIQSLVADGGVPAAEIKALLHGTTVPTNTVLEQRGARIGLLVTQDFEQVLHLARARTPGPLAGWTKMDAPAPLADLELTRGVPERINAQGDVLTPLDEVEARRAIRELADARVDAITVSLLHAYANPAHEQRLKAMIEELAPGTPVSLSSEVLPEYREYERTLLTVMNAYVRPRMDRYLSGIEAKLQASQVAAPVSIVRSDGGLMSAQRAAEAPVHAMRSGPAGGVAGAAYVAGLAGHPDALAFDMGGTSTEASLIRDGRPTIARQTRLASYPLKVPAVDVHSIGAGGGSIARIPMAGALRVGPDSAGAVPGPACYGRGGDAATVTDANLVLGRLPTTLLGGDMPLDTKAAEDAVGRIGRELGLDVYQAAQAILDIVNEQMAGALRLVAVEKGLDPRDFALVAFGGAGPLHGNAMALATGCYPLIVPPGPGALSALGFLTADVRHEVARSVLRPLDTMEQGEVGALLDRLGGEARDRLQGENIAAADQTVRCEADLRYLRQGTEFTLDVDPERLADGGLDDLAGRFARAHERRYGFTLAEPVELVTVRVIGTGAVSKAPLPDTAPGGADAKAAVSDQHRVYFDGHFATAKVYDRALLRAGNSLPGPAVVTQTDSTTLIHPGHVGTVDRHLNILI